jgi:hypothetical protein
LPGRLCFTRHTSKIAAVLVAALIVAPGIGACSGEDEAKEPTTEAAGEARKGDSYEGGEESVEEFGSEAEGSSKKAVLAAEHVYLSAVAERDFREACSFLSASVQRSLERFAVPKLKAKGCPAILPQLLASTAPGVARQQAEGEIKRVRVNGNMAFVIFHAPGARLYVLAMRREGGAWKATTIFSSILAPSAATVGTE